MAKFLVTGGAGFIGSHIVRECVANGHQVVVLDNFTTGRMNNLLGIEDSVEILQGDIRDTKIVAQAMDQVDYVSHHAAVGLVGPTVQDPLYADSVNVHGFLTVLCAAKEAGVKRVVSASSAAVYGQAEGIVRHEDMMCVPESPYAVTKLVGEHYAHIFSSLYGLDTVSLRYFNVYGPCQPVDSVYSSVVAVFMKRILNKQPIIIHGDGTQQRDFVFVGDVAQANVLAALHTGPLSGGVYNIGSGKSYMISEVADFIQQAIGTSVEIVHEPRRQGDLDKSKADISKARTEFSFVPKTDFLQGIRALANWHEVHVH